MNEELLKSIMYLFVGIAVLLCGMKFMSGGLKKITGRGLRNFFRKTQNNAFLGLAMGTVISLVTSSDATSALVIGFINAGAMTIFQGISIMLGGYIGTTITGILASFSSLPISIYLLSLAFIGTMMMFFTNEKIKNIGEILCGLGLLFFGLAVMKDAFGNADIKAFCTSMFASINFPILLFFIGLVVTALAQSSSAVTGIIIAMVGGGAIPLSSALYIALGATLGTVATTLLSSITGNVEGKRTAVTAFILRLISSAVAVALVWIFEQYIVTGLQAMAIGGSDEFPLAMFILIYNLIFMPMLIPLIKPVSNLVARIVKDKKKDEYADAVEFIDDGLLKSPDIALMQARKEIVHMYDLSFENYKRGLERVVGGLTEGHKEVAKTEGQIDYLNERITDFLIKLAPLVQTDSERKVGTYFHVINDIERIGDHGFNFSESADAMLSEELSFSDAAKTELAQMDKKIQEMFVMARECFAEKQYRNLKKLREYEETIHQLKQDFYSNHYERVLKEECSQQMTPYISTLIVELERVADHLTNIGYSIVNPTGDSEETTPKKTGRRRKARQ
ncbi:MAG: Na/Pi cotransporter family protein [Bacilli bacterium]|nr:Na/Pi cotransporter family protein [Bacilli bacterium]